VTSLWPSELARSYGDVIELFEQSVRDCPEALWGAPVWRVRKEDRHAWPIVGGMGEELADDDRLQLHAAFWNVVFHALSATDGYLDVGVETPHPLRAAQPPMHFLPARPYSRDELLDYVAFCREKAKRTFSKLTEDDAAGPSLHRPPRDTLAHVLIHNLLHLNEHSTQLRLFLNLRADWSDERWLVSNRWFTPCEHCGSPRS
jgi:hypothetical protein